MEWVALPCSVRHSETNKNRDEKLKGECDCRGIFISIAKSNGGLGLFKILIFSRVRGFQFWITYGNGYILICPLGMKTPVTTLFPLSVKPMHRHQTFTQTYMKNHQSFSIITPRLSQLALASTLCMVFSLPVASLAENSVSALADTKYEFFVGIDVRVPYDNAELPMVDFRNDNMILWSQDRPVSVEFGKIKGLRFFRSPKLSRENVEIRGFDAKYIASRVSDTRTKMNMMLLQGLAEDNRDVAYGNAQFVSASNIGSYDQTSGSTTLSLQNLSTSSVDKLKSGNVEPGDKKALSAKDANGEASDTIDIQFSVSSASPVDDVYAVVLAVIKKSGGDADVQKWVRFQRIGRIDDTPRHIHVTQSGIPVEFELIGAQAFLFSHGEEIANTMSDMHVTVSSESARHLINACYIDAHKGMTLVPALATTSIADSLVDSLKSEGVNEPVTLHLDKDAIITAAECEGKPVSLTALNLLKTLIFHPGLKNGEPVEALVKIDIAQFSEKNLRKLASQ
jgi:hypothetical protein